MVDSLLKALNSPLGSVWKAVFDDSFLPQVEYHGQPVAAVLARSQEEAQAAARAVAISYEELKPVVTIEDAIAANTTLRAPSRIECGDVDAAFPKYGT